MINERGERMDNKKIIKIAFVILGVFCVFALIEIIIRAAARGVNHVAEYVEERRQEKIEYNSDEQKTNRQIMAFIDNVMNAIKQDDIQFVYRSLQQSYRKYLFHDSVNELKEYIHSNYRIGKEYRYKDITLNGGMYQVIVELSSGDSASEKTITAKVLDENSCTIMLGEYTKFTPMDQVLNFEDFKVTLLYEYQTKGYLGYVMQFENKLDKDLKISFTDNSKLIEFGGRIYTGTKPSSLTLKPNSQSNIQAVFYQTNIGVSYITMDVVANDVSKEITFDFST